MSPIKDTTSVLKDEAIIKKMVYDPNNIDQLIRISKIKLPEPIEVKSKLLSNRPVEESTDSPVLSQGCFLIKYSPSIFTPIFHYDGTIRVQLDGSNIIASGDMYLHTLLLNRTEPNPSLGIPIFRIANYRYYLRVTNIINFFIFMQIDFEQYRFESPNTWINEGSFSAHMIKTPAPVGYPSSSDYYVGFVRDSSGTRVGDLTMGWVSPFFRRATIEIDRVAASELPSNTGLPVGWGNIFNLVGWDVTVIHGDSSVPEPNGEFWSDAELHNAMLSWRDASDLDSQWRYHILCVRRLDSTTRGIMYDDGGTDSNNLPREGAAISSHWVIPNSDPWGLVKGLRFGTASSPYFRTVLHEIGHAMGLYHNTIDNGIMNTTETIAFNAVPPIQFPDNIQWSHAPDDQKGLRHFPDIWVRPGGISFGESYPPVLPDDMILVNRELDLKVTSVEEAIPIGAPVRINYVLKNNSENSYIVPRDLSMKSGNTSGKVIDPSGMTRTFFPIIKCLDERNIVKLDPNKSVSDSATVLRGSQGYLFPLPGLYTIIVEISWDLNGIRQRISGSTNVMITPPFDAEHAKAAYKIIANPDSLLVLVIGGDHLEKGMQAIKIGLDNPVLKPHYSYIEAKRISRKFGKREPNLAAAAKLIDHKTVMSVAEVKKMAKVIKEEKKNIPEKALEDIKNTLIQKIKNLHEEDQARKMVESL